MSTKGRSHGVEFLAVYNPISEKNLTYTGFLRTLFGVVDNLCLRSMIRCARFPSVAIAKMFTPVQPACRLVATSGAFTHS
jgi:hypothetical protein